MQLACPGATTVEVTVEEERTVAVLNRVAVAD